MCNIIQYKITGIFKPFYLGEGPLKRGSGLDSRESPPLQIYASTAWARKCF